MLHRVRRLMLTAGLLRYVSCFSAVVALVLVYPPVAVTGQETRTEVIAQREAEKAQRLSPPRLSKAERIIIKLEDYYLREPGNFFPSFDSVYAGGGFTFGGGYRRFYGDHSLWSLTGLYSLRNYKQVEALTLAPDLLRGRLAVGADGGWRDATQIAFYGLGTEAPEENRTNFRLKEWYFDSYATLEPARNLFLTGRFSYEDYTLDSGEGSHPSIETRFTPATAPGLGDNPAFFHSAAAAAYDWRTAPDYTRNGGYYRLAFHNYTDLDEIYSFDRLDAEVVQHIPILRETWVLSLRGRVETTVDDDDVVPYFLLPSLGSGSTLRAYPSWRFRDRHSLLMSGEWRWIPNRLALDMAIFYDTGKVAPRRGDLDFEGLKSNWGIGARFHGLVTTPLRIELARGSEGWNLVFSGSAAF